jgi:uncharacterized protein
MVIGKISGRSSTNYFEFSVDGFAQKFEYVQVKHREGFEVLAQIVEIEKANGETKAKCNVLGYRSQSDILKNLRTPLEPGAEVNYAGDAFVKQTLGLHKTKYGAYVGVLDGRDDISVYLEMNKMISKHVAVLAKTGAGKSYCLSVLLEEVMQKNVPIIVIDPHGEYSSLKHPTDSLRNLERFRIDPKGFGQRIVEYSPDIEKNPEATALKLSSENLTGVELMHMLPAKLSGSQIGLLYSAIKGMESSINFDDILINLQLEEHGAKWSIISLVEYMKKLDIFSKNPTPLNELVKPGKCSVINLRGVPVELQEIVVYKLASDLFGARKRGEVPPFFLVVEEAHNFCPERNYGEAKSSKIIRQIVAEGRKFGLGMAVVSQRPARIEKTVLSQCNTQVILKITNPNDLKAISNSVEGITHETEKEIRNLHIGKAMIVGVVDLPLFVEIRPRMTKHGGETVNIVNTFMDLDIDEEHLAPSPEEEVIVEETQDVSKSSKQLFNVVVPRVNKQDLEAEEGIDSVRTILSPCMFLNCLSGGVKFNLLINLSNGHVVTDLNEGEGLNLNAGLQGLSEREQTLLGAALAAGKSLFSAAQLFSMSGMQFSEVFDLTNTMVSKGYFMKEANNFKFSDALSGLIGLKEKAFAHKVEFMPVEYDEVKESIVNKNALVSFLNNFVKIASSKDCYLVHYEVTEILDTVDEA